MQHFDLAVLGGGSGLMISEAALARGLSCAVVEKGALGGTCLNRGCIPSKMLVYPADLIREAERGERVGVGFSRPDIDWAKIAGRMQRQIDVNHDLERELSVQKGLTLFRGEGAFVDAHTIQVKQNSGGTVAFTADKIVIATGSRTRIPDVKGLQEVGYQTSESIFGGHFPDKPYDSLLVIGGGATGCEFAHIFSAMDTKVTLAALRGQLLRGWEKEIAESLRRQMEEMGLAIHTNLNSVAAVMEGGLKKVTFQNTADGSEAVFSAQEIFLAPGIVPNTDMLNLQAAGVLTDHRGFVLTNKRLATNLSHIYAIGDVNGTGALRHKANYEAEVLNDVLFGEDRRRADYSATPQAIYTFPQCARVGMTEDEARAAGIRPRVAYNHLCDVVAGISMGYRKSEADDGFVKIITDPSGILLGVHVIGPQAAVLVQPFAYLMNAGGERQLKDPGSISPISRSMVIHPSLSELTAWALGNFKDA